MILKLKHIRKILFATVTVILCSQIAWVYNMHQVYQKEFQVVVDNSLKRAISREFSMRYFQAGGSTSSRFYSSIGDTLDESYIVEKTITSDDGRTFKVNIDTQDPDAMDKYFQFLLKKSDPVDINKLKALFTEELEKSRFQIKDAYFDYLDLDEGKIIETNKPVRHHLYSYVSESAPLDLFNTIGIKIYVDATLFTFLDKMLFQLILSVVMIVIASICLVYLSKTIFIQHKIAKNRQTFVSTMTHEFKRPIANAIALLDMAFEYLNRDNKEKVALNIQQTQFQLNKLSAYTQRIQEINRNEESKIQLNRQKINTIDFFRTLHEIYEKSAIMKFTFETKQSVIYADVIHFSNVMDNLIENAIKYSNTTPQINITVKEDSQNTILSVQDDGYGISASDKKHIFDKFFRVNDRRVQKKSGFGLGLTYVKTIVEAHGGKILVESELNKGSIFTIIMPQKI